MAELNFIFIFQTLKQSLRFFFFTCGLPHFVLLMAIFLIFVKLELNLISLVLLVNMYMINMIF